MRIRDWLIEAKKKLFQSPQEPVSSLWVLLSYILNKTKLWLISNEDIILSDSQILQLDDLLERLISGEPLAYLIGHWSFFGMDFIVNPSVLIPRPETELLVENALKWLNANPSRRCMAEIGIGSGCISISLSKQILDLQIYATDISLAALNIAKQNILQYSLNNILLIQSNLLDCISKKFDLICANLPYIRSSSIQRLPVSKYEPLQALDGGKDGLFYTRNFLRDAQSYLSGKSMLLMEIESTQKNAVIEIANQHFRNSSIQVIDDLAHLPRLLIIQTK